MNILMYMYIYTINQPFPFSPPVRGAIVLSTVERDDGAQIEIRDGLNGRGKAGNARNSNRSDNSQRGMRPNGAMACYSCFNWDSFLRMAYL